MTILAYYFSTPEGAVHTPDHRLGNGERLLVVIREGPKFVTVLDPFGLRLSRLAVADWRRKSRPAEDVSERRVLTILRRNMKGIRRLGVSYPRKAAKAAEANLKASLLCRDI